MSALERRKSRLNRAERVLAVARVLMRFDGYGSADDVLLSDNPKCAKWHHAAEAIIATLEAME